MTDRFIAEPITVEFDVPPLLEKAPGCPDRLIWRGETLRVARPLAEWRDYRRRGRMAQNMRPAHRERAEQKGSWGVGRFYFRVLLTDGRVFELYYDRAPRASRKGDWVLSKELLRGATPDGDEPAHA